MDVPCTVAGTVTAVHIKVGDKVSEGALIIEVSAAGSAAPQPVAAPAPVAAPVQAAAAPVATAPTPIAAGVSVAYGSVNEEGFAKAHAGPSTRKLARELGVDLSLVKGTGAKGRITAEDVKGFVKA